ncbi:MAG: phosphoribosylanthranilate isomerase [Nanoarchaeota archaeon]|nr:phosphoribosylanthranilate isomerase [Nanoarchaeota archaeon]
MTKVKICGIANSDDALQAAVLGANFLGFIVEVKFSEESITREEAKTLIQKLPLEIQPVLVTYLQHATPLIHLADHIKPQIIQLHNEITLDEIGKIRQALPKIKLTKTISVTDESSIKEAKKFEQYVDYLLLDTKVGERRGGTGKTHDWSLSAEIVKQVNIPVFLAGGLNPENVAQAIKTVNPYAVDVNSGVKATAKRKDHKKMEQFIMGAKHGN